MMEFVKDSRNDLLNRREVEFVLNAEGNPGFEAVKKKLAEGLKVSDENVVIKGLKNNFGANDFLVEALVYDSLEHLQRIEPRKKEKKKSGS